MRFLPSLLLLACTLPAQRLVTYEPFGNVVNELQPPTALLPAANPPLATYPGAPVLPVPPAALAGDATFDNVTGLFWYTNGGALAAMPITAFPPVGPVPPVLPIPPALLAALGGGPISGIAIDALAGVMFLTSMPGLVVGVALLPGLPVVIPPFAVPAPAGVGVTGLEFDGRTGSLWAVTAPGGAVEFAIGGALLSPPVPPPPFLPGPALDIAIDKLDLKNPVGLRPLYVSSGGIVVDIRDPAPIVFPSGPPAAGLAFVNAPASVPPLPGCEGCPGSHPGPTAFTNGPTTTGNAAFAVGAGGLPPGTVGLIAFDVTTAPLPFVPLNGPSWCPAGLSPTPSLILLPGLAGAGGAIVLPIPLTVVSVGSLLHNQNVTLCAAHPSGLAFSRLQTLVVGGL